jgi:hypothetical protein
MSSAHATAMSVGRLLCWSQLRRNTWVKRDPALGQTARHAGSCRRRCLAPWPLVRRGPRWRPGSLGKSVSSGTRGLHPEGHLVLADTRIGLGIADALEQLAVQRALTPSIIDVAHIGGDALRIADVAARGRRRSATRRPACSGERKPEDHSRFESACTLVRVRHLGGRCTTNVGSSSFDRAESVARAMPRSRDGREHVAGRAFSRMAGSWLIASVCSDADHAELVGHLRRVRKQLRVHPHARLLPMLAELVTSTARSETAPGWQVIAGEHAGRRAPIPGRSLSYQSRSAAACSPGLKLRGRAGHEEVNGALSLRRKVRATSRASPPVRRSAMTRADAAQSSPSASPSRPSPGL